MWNHFDTVYASTISRGFDMILSSLPEGSISAGDFLESAGRLVYTGSSLLVKPGELEMVMLRLINN